MAGQWGRATPHPAANTVSLCMLLDTIVWRLSRVGCGTKCEGAGCRRSGQYPGLVQGMDGCGCLSSYMCVCMPDFCDVYLHETAAGSRLTAHILALLPTGYPPVGAGAPLSLGRRAQRQRDARLGCTPGPGYLVPHRLCADCSSRTQGPVLGRCSEPCTGGGTLDGASGVPQAASCAQFLVYSQVVRCGDEPSLDYFP